MYFPNNFAARCTLTAALVLSAAPASAQDSSPAERITGVVRVNGCVLEPDDIVLRAQAFGGGAPGLEDVAPDPSEGQFATLESTADPHELAFTIRHLTPHGTYRLAIRPAAVLLGGAPGECNKLFWKGPFEGLAVAGGSPVVIEGFAARTTVEILRPGENKYVGADRVDLTSPDSAVRHFRWRTNLSDITGAELQIATDPFPIVTADGNACAEPASGIAARRVLRSAGTDWQSISGVDLLAALRPPVPIPAIAASAQPPTLRELAYRAALRGAPLYVRVVPLRDDQPACDVQTDGVPGWVLLANVITLEGSAEPMNPQITAGDGQAYEPPFFDPHKPYSHPFGDQYAYVVVKEHTLPTVSQLANPFSDDPLGRKLVLLGIFPPGATLYPDGTYFWIDPGEGSWWDDLTDSIGDLVTGAIDAIGFMVNKLAAVWQQVKTAVRDVIVDAIDAIPGLECSDEPPSPGVPSCSQLVEYGMDAALASAGIPPNLPNWDELKQMGIDYAAAEVASQTGLPPAITEYAAHQLSDEVVQRMDQNRGGKDPQYNWVEPYFGFDPADLFVTINKTEGDLPTNVVLALGKSELYERALVPVPAKFQGTVRIPIVLPQNVEDVPPPTCYGPFGNVVPCSKAYQTRWYRNHFRDKVDNAGCVPFHAFTFSLAGTFEDGLLLTPPANLQLELFAVVPPRDPISWNGAFFTADSCQ
jgi:hypothetical protein